MFMCAELHRSSRKNLSCSQKNITYSPTSSTSSQKLSFFMLFHGEFTWNFTIFAWTSWRVCEGFVKGLWRVFRVFVIVDPKMWVLLLLLLWNACILWDIKIPFTCIHVDVHGFLMKFMWTSRDLHVLLVFWWGVHINSWDGVRVGCMKLPGFKFLLIG